MVDKKELD